MYVQFLAPKCGLFFPTLFPALGLENSSDVPRIRPCLCSVSAKPDRDGETGEVPVRQPKLSPGKSLGKQFQSGNMFQEFIWKCLQQGACSTLQGALTSGGFACSFSLLSYGGKRERKVPRNLHTCLLKALFKVLSECFSWMLRRAS